MNLEQNAVHGQGKLTGNNVPNERIDGETGRVISELYPHCAQSDIHHLVLLSQVHIA